MAERCQASGKLLDILQVLGLLHPVDCSNFFRIAFNASRRNKKTEQLAGWNAEHALLWIELDLVCAQVCECLSEVVQQCLLLDLLDY